MQFHTGFIDNFGVVIKPDGLRLRRGQFEIGVSTECFCYVDSNLVFRRCVSHSAAQGYLTGAQMQVGQRFARNLRLLRQWRRSLILDFWRRKDGPTLCMVYLRITRIFMPRTLKLGKRHNSEPRCRPGWILKSEFLCIQIKTDYQDHMFGEIDKYRLLLPNRGDDVLQPVRVSIKGAIVGTNPPVVAELGHPFNKIAEMGAEEVIVRRQRQSFDFMLIVRVAIVGHRHRCARWDTQIYVLIDVLYRK